MPSMYIHSDCYVQHGPLKAEEAQFHEEGEFHKTLPSGPRRWGSSESTRNPVAPGRR